MSYTQEEYRAMRGAVVRLRAAAGDVLAAEELERREKPPLVLPTPEPAEAPMDWKGSLSVELSQAEFVVRCPGCGESRVILVKNQGGEVSITFPPLVMKGQVQ